MLTNDVSKTVLPNGLTVLTERTSAEVKTIGLGVWLKTGARHDAEFNGLSHFVEHMAFKRTTTRTSTQINITSDELGGYFGASTGDEVMIFQATVLDANLELAMGHIADLVLNPSYNEEDVNREHGVVIEEAKAAFDNPGWLAMHYLLQTILDGDPLSRSITGTAETIQKIDVAALGEFARERFTGSNLVLGCSSNREHLEILRLAVKFFGVAPAGKPIARLPEPLVHVGRSMRVMGIEQVHMVLGCPAPCRSDERHFAAVLLSMVLGDGPSSRIFASIREERGLVYEIQSQYEAKSNVGMLDIYCALAPENVPLVLKLIREELRSLSQMPPSQEEVERAKCKYRTQVTVEGEFSSGRVGNLVGPFLALGRIQPFSELMQLIEDVSPAQIHSLARDLFRPEQMSISLVGNVKGLNPDELVL